MTRLGELHMLSTKLLVGTNVFLVVVGRTHLQVKFGFIFQQTWPVVFNCASLGGELKF